MINKDISNSCGFAKLSANAAVLFVMIIPHLNSHGKLNGGLGFLKDEVCPRIPYLTNRNIPKLLQEITEKTNVKWFDVDGRHWIHSINFLKDHQKLSESRLGRDLLPTYSGSTPLEVEVEVEGKGEGEGKSGVTPVPSKNGHPHLSPLSILWNKTCLEFPKVIDATDGRREKERTRLKKRSLAAWEVVFKRINVSQFCQGDNQRKWVASYDWIINNDENAVKVLEGKYDDRKPFGRKEKNY
ncbi:MAG: hypothetical protein ABGX83_05375 [Nitrospira sp.]